MTFEQVKNTGLASDVGRANLLTNGGFEIWQRGTGPFTTSTWFADRWQISLGGTSTVSLNRFSASSGPGGGISYGASVSYTHNADSILLQDLKLSEFFSLRGQTLSLSMMTATGVANAMSIAIFGDGTGAVAVGSSTHPGTGAWAKLSAIGYVVPTDATYVRAYVLMHASGAYYVDNAMLVVGNVAADYAPMHPADDLMRCLRYYEKMIVSMRFSMYTGGTYEVVLPQKAVKPVNPTMTITAGSRANVGAGYPSQRYSDNSSTTYFYSGTANGDCYALSEIYTMEANP